MAPDRVGRHHHRRHRRSRCAGLCHLADQQARHALTARPMASARRRSERGAIAIEFMLVLSMLVVVFLVMLQYAVRAHAHRIVTAAAEEGLAATAAYDGSAEAGRQA